MGSHFSFLSRTRDLMLLLGLQEWRKRQIDAQYDVDDDDAFWEVDNDSYDD